ncbi:MAG: SNF2 family N-terminal domain-containing protein [Benjaminiella poitrasii]|nr:MAG: SNF2 family N-terminal domain-containing protein [Benjaminiella poitrasii]
MTTIINGSIGKIQEIYELLLDLQDSSHLHETDLEANRNKRLKTMNQGDHPYCASGSMSLDRTLYFPLSFPNSDPAVVQELARDISRFSEQALDVKWNFTRVEDSVFVSMKAATDVGNRSVVEYEFVCAGNQFQEDAVNVIQNESQLFVAIVYAAQAQCIRAGNVQLANDAYGRFCLQMDLYRNSSRSHQLNKAAAAKLLIAISNKITIKTEKPITPEKLIKTEKPETPETIGNKHISRSSTTGSQQHGSIVPSPAILSSKKAVPSGSKKATPSSSLFANNIKKRHLVNIKDNTSDIDLAAPSVVPQVTTIDDFYDYLQPPVSNTYLESYTSDAVIARLTPFQTQNVQWMIHREGQAVNENNENNEIVPNYANYQALPLLYTGSHDPVSPDRGHYMNVFTNAASTDRTVMNELIDRSYRGGILADEMGLGKTVSVLGLIARHTWSADNAFHPKPEEDESLVFSRGTLIIAPSSIIPQWQSEVKTHAPGMSVFVYEGRRHNQHISPEELAQYDIVLTHYEAFNSEINYANLRSDRPQRRGVEYNKYTYKPSPLIKILWFRCILDEAQMIEASLTKIASLAKSIPRWYAWAVTGTPIRNGAQYRDLYGLYSFLLLEKTFKKEGDFQKFCRDHRNSFLQFAHQTIRRNAKARLAEQVHIPPQSRHVVRIPFSTIEQHYYDDLWRSCQEELRLDWLDSINWTPTTAADQAGYDAVRAKMRAWLLALRQNCIHPSMINNQSMKLGRVSEHATRGTKSLTEVLHDMLRNAFVQLDNEQHAYYGVRLKQGGMREVLQQWRTAYELYEQSVADVEGLVKHHVEEVRTAKVEEEEAPSDAASAVLKYSSTTLAKWQILLHQYYFYMAGVCHRLALEQSEDHDHQDPLETMYYGKAAEVRRVLLDSYIHRVKNGVKDMKETTSRIQSIDEGRFRMGTRPELDVQALIDSYRQYYERLHPEADIDQQEADQDEMKPDINVLKNLKYTGVALDRQYDKILYLRSKILPILTKPLVDEQDEEATGDEYEDSLQQQELCQAYLNAYRSLLQDRKFIVNGTQVSITEILFETDDDHVHVSQEAKQIEATEKTFRKSLMSPTDYKVECLKDVEFSLRTLKHKYPTIPLGESSNSSHVVLQNEHAHLKAKLQVQTRLVDDLDTDFKKLSQLFNSRIAYYKYLQSISDTLLEWQHVNPTAQIAKLDESEHTLKNQIVQSKSRYHYFKALVDEQQLSLDQGAAPARKHCLMCEEPMEKGMITYCGHTCCSDCGLIWFRQNRRCHTCNSRVEKNQWYTISYKVMDMRRKGGSNNNGSSSSNDEDADHGLKLLISQINQQQITKGGGEKIDSIIRHIKHIKMNNNGKCVVFSQWAKALDMLKESFDNNDIQYTTVQGGSVTTRQKSVRRFQEDPNVSVILLHARSQSSGLTLVAAHTVFIVEPVLNESLEKQAINRIHRIGQTKETNVFWYIVQDTIEERIHAIHDIKREQHHYGHRQQQEKVELSKVSEGGGEFVSNDDLRRCFTSDEAFALR